MEVWISTNGKYPRSEELVRATRDYDRRRIGEKELEEAYLKDYEDLKQLQEGEHLVSDGLLNWQDIVRPFAYLVKEAYVGGLVRYFETNTFYRKLYFKDKSVENTQQWFERFFKFGNLAILPSPYTLFRFSEEISFSEAVELVKHVVYLLKSKSYRYFYFQEPTLFYYRDADFIDSMVKAMNEIKSILSSEIVVLNTYFAEVSELIKPFMESDLDGIGIDFTRNSIEDISNVWNRSKGMVAGILDNTNVLMETEDVVRKLLDSIFSLNLPFVVLTGCCDFELLPRNVADMKYRFLREVKRSIS